MTGRTGAVMKSIPAQRVAGSSTVPEVAAGTRPRGGWPGRFWRRYLRMSVAAEPLLSTVWIHGRCIDVSIYDRDWPESYRY